MGLADFYINISFNNIEQVRIFEKNYINLNLSHLFSIVMNLDDYKYEVSCECLIDNLLPTCIILFDIINLYEKNYEFSIESYGIKKKYEFAEEKELIDFIFIVNKNKIREYYAKLGMLAMNRKTYYKKRNKFKKIYFKYNKLP